MAGAGNHICADVATWNSKVFHMKQVKHLKHFFSQNADNQNFKN
jgi:hypothetical protein